MVSGNQQLKNLSDPRKPETHLVDNNVQVYTRTDKVMQMSVFPDRRTLLDTFLLSEDNVDKLTVKLNMDHGNILENAKRIKVVRSPIYGTRAAKTTAKNSPLPINTNSNPR